MLRVSLCTMFSRRRDLDIFRTSYDRLWALGDVLLRRAGFKRRIRRRIRVRRQRMNYFMVRDLCHVSKFFRSTRFCYYISRVMIRAGRRRSIRGDREVSRSIRVRITMLIRSVT